VATVVQKFTAYITSVPQQSLQSTLTSPTLGVYFQSSLWC